MRFETRDSHFRVTQFHSQLASPFLRQIEAISTQSVTKMESESLNCSVIYQRFYFLANSILDFDVSVIVSNSKCYCTQHSSPPTLKNNNNNKTKHKWRFSNRCREHIYTFFNQPIEYVESSRIRLIFTAEIMPGVA